MKLKHFSKLLSEETDSTSIFYSKIKDEINETIKELKEGMKANNWSKVEGVISKLASLSKDLDLFKINSEVSSFKEDDEEE